MTGIEWTNETWNPVVGCRKVSSGCKHCYAMRQAARVVHCQRPSGNRSPYEDVLRMDDDGDPRPEWNGTAKFVPERLEMPLRWRKPRRVFVNSMSDLFHTDITFDEIAAVWGVMASTPRHTYQVLTKRPERMLKFFAWLDCGVDGSGEDHLTAIKAHALCDFSSPEIRFRGDIWSESLHPKRGEAWPLPNVWLGVSAEDQPTADERIPTLLGCPAAVRFVSAEPLLGPIEFYTTYHRLRKFRGGLDWVIVGGESGPDARPCNLKWIRSIVDQCQASQAPVFVKQLGSNPYREKFYRSRSESAICGFDKIPFDLDDRKGGDPDEWPEDLRVREWPEGAI